MFEFLHMETVHALIGPPDAGDDVSIHCNQLIATADFVQ